MTIALALKVSDGIVLGADSAATILNDQGVLNVYSSAEKIINLRKGLPIGIASYGLGGMHGRSITSLAKDLRRRLSNAEHDWHLDPVAYTMQEVAGRVQEFFYNELYHAEFLAPDGVAPGEGQNLPGMGFLIAGFSGRADHPEVWELEITPTGDCAGPVRVFDRPDAGAVVWKGAPEALNRLLLGYTDEAMGRLTQAGVPPNAASQILVQQAHMAHAAMPVQDAIDLVYYLTRVTCGFVRFMPGAPTVSGPVDIAAITKHERFRWIRRKHYYRQQLNPPHGMYDADDP